MENKTDFPPFYVGQKVVAIKDHSQGAFRKGETFVVIEVIRCPCNCKYWVIDIGKIWTESEFSRCRICEHRIKGFLSYYNASCFAPIESQFHSITFEQVVEIESPLIGVN